MPLDSEVLRSCILEALRREPKTQFISLEIATARVAQERGLIGASPPDYRDPHLPAESSRRFRETAWALIIEGVLVVGMDDNNAAWPWLSLTEYGEEVAGNQTTTPYDPSGYLDSLRVVRPLDDVEERYIPQALQAFRRNLPDAAAVMLGGASEHLIGVLGEAVIAADPSIGAGARKKLDGPALATLMWVQTYVSARKSKLPRRLAETLDTTFLGIASLIRITRNDAGHPALAPVSREQVFVNLQLFPVLRRWVWEVIPLLPLF
jgi:hypothetical protein